MTEKLFLSPRELAIRWGKCTETIRRKCRQGKIKHKIMDNRIMIRIEDIIKMEGK